MKEIDFDELDRAVNSLMSNVPSNAPKPVDTTDSSDAVSSRVPSTAASSDDVVDPQPPESDADTEEPVAAPVLNFDSPTEPAPEASQDQPEEAEVEVEVETFSEAMQLVEEGPTAPAAPAARRGRFMDVVRPSVREVSKPAPSRAVSRHGIALQPSMASPEDTPHVPDMATQPSDSASEYTAMHDVFTQPVAQENDVISEPVTPEVTDSEAPLSSPFLPDAKVEKRPLGRPVEVAPTVDLAAELAMDAVEDTTASAAYEDVTSPHVDAQLPEQPLPAELGSELLTIETSMDNLPSEPVQAAQSEVPQSSTAVGTPSSTQTPEPTRVMTGASIPQQYKVQPQMSMDEAPSSAIYDAQPLMHTAEKKSSWLWKIVAIIAIALLGAGGGAAIYYLGLI